MATLIYANANSLFDYSNGAARSIKLLLEAVASSGTHVRAITSCASDSQAAFIHSKRLWTAERQRAPGQHPLIQRFNKNGVHYSLTICDDHRRQSVTSLVQELIYREAELTLEAVAQAGKRGGFLSWGNLLLEEALYRRSRGLGLPTFFYLANPSYLGKPWPTRHLVDMFWTDSAATQSLYRKQLTSPINILPKIIAPCTKHISPTERHRQRTITLINPCIKKGLEYLIKLASACEQHGYEHQFLLVDGAGKLDRDLCQLKLKRNHLPSNIQIRDGNPDTDELLIDTSILLLLSTWHESGSRLIHEGHQRGIPVLAFATGGTPELMAHTPVDLFEPPEQSGNWDPSPILQRINTLLSNSDQYALHSRDLIKKVQEIEASNQSKAIQSVLSSLKRAAAHPPK